MKTKQQKQDELLISLQSALTASEAKVVELEATLKLGFDNFSIWLTLNKGHICMGEIQKQQFYEILKALESEDKT